MLLGYNLSHWPWAKMKIRTNRNIRIVSYCLYSTFLLSVSLSLSLSCLIRATDADARNQEPSSKNRNVLFGYSIFKASKTELIHAFQFVTSVIRFSLLLLVFHLIFHFLLSFLALYMYNFQTYTYPSLEATSEQ